MASGSSPNFLFQSVNKILSTFVPAHGHQEKAQLYASIGEMSSGTITFPDNRSSRAEFIRVPPQASVVHVKELLQRHWCKGRPSLVISVTGGAKDYNMKPKLLRAFRRGLLKVARTTGAWIITGGMNTGIMKLVGEVVQMNPDRSRPIHLIGIGTWGCVSDFRKLEGHRVNAQYTRSRSDKKGEAPLEPNHTEFIFVDDGTERKYGGEITFRAQLEQAISGDFFSSRTTAISEGQRATLSPAPSLRPDTSDPVPVVLIVVEGGPNTVRTVHEAVVQNNIPAVFIDGTGRCCNLFAKALRLYNDYRQKFGLAEDTSHLDPVNLLRRYEELKHKLREELKEDLCEISGTTDGAKFGPGKGVPKNSSAKPNKSATPTDTTDYFELVYQCIDTRTNFLNIVSLKPRTSVEPDIDVAILQALLNATSGIGSARKNASTKCKQLQLALEWNRVDIAKHHIMKDERDWEKIDLNAMFEVALQRNQIEFVKLFLDHDLSLSDVFRNANKLPSLYQDNLDQLCYLDCTHVDSLHTVYRELIQPLVGDFFEVSAACGHHDECSGNSVDPQKEPTSCLCCASLLGDRPYRAASMRDPANSNTSEVILGRMDNAHDHLDVDKELFLWSVLTGRRDFSLLFWARGKNKICAALLAALIYRKRARKENDVSYEQSANEFESLAVQILDKFYQGNTYACTKALIRQIPAYGNVTWLQIAVAAEAKEFIAQRGVQDVLNNIWFGHIDQRVSQKQIIFCTSMVFFSGFLRYDNELVKTGEEKGSSDHTLARTHSFQHQSSTANLNPDRTRTYVIQHMRNILTFLRAPYVKYLYSLYFHVIFLALFSYMLLCDFFPLYEFQTDVCAPANDPERLKDAAGAAAADEKNVTGSVSFGFQRHDRPAVTEFIVTIWVFTLLCEEVRQFFSLEAQTMRNAITAYFEVIWNKLDVLAIILYFVGLALRFAPYTECFCAARIVMSIDLTIWFIRSLDLFAAVKRLGPKLVMIGEMVHDLKVYMLMLTVFILGFGVTSYTLIYGVREFTWHLPREIINLAYWQIFGELNALDTFEHNYKPNGYAVFILLVIYMAIVSILLVNLLIAMFSNTFDRLQTDTDRIWKFQRYSLICEYLSRPALPPPFIFVSHLWRLTLYALSPCIRLPWLTAAYAQHTNRTKYKIILDERFSTYIEAAEDAHAEEVYYNHMKMNRHSVDDNDLDEERIHSPQENMLNKIRSFENRLEVMKTQQSHMFEYLECLMDGLQMLGGDRIKMPERRRFDPEDSFEEANNNGEQTRRFHRRESTIDDARPSTPQTDDKATVLVNLLPTREH